MTYCIFELLKASIKEWVFVVDVGDLKFFFFFFKFYLEYFNRKFCKVKSRI